VANPHGERDDQCAGNQHLRDREFGRVMNVHVSIVT
jgi:hypothetical protein